MYEQQLRWPVFLVIGCLFDPNLVQVPNVDPSVTRRRREDRGVVRRPREAQDFVGMGLERMNPGCWFTEVVETNRLDASCLRAEMKWTEKSTNLVRTSRDDKPLLYGVVSDRKNFFIVGLVLVGRVRPRSSVPTKPKDQNVGRTADDSTTYIMSTLSSPTLAKMFSFWWFQSTSY
jgi:hypothetical protein